MDNIDDFNIRIEECLQQKHSSILYLLFHKFRMEEFVDIFFNDTLNSSLLDKLFEHRDVWESMYDWLQRNEFFQYYTEPEQKYFRDFLIYKWSENTPLTWKNTEVELVYNTPTTVRHRTEGDRVTPTGTFEVILQVKEGT